jgi:hypothetical protein
VPHEIAAVHSRNLHGFKNEPALLVVYQGPAELASPSGVMPAAAKMYTPDNPPFAGDVIRLSQLPEYATNPDVRSLALVNLNEVEKRVMQTIATA